MKIFIILLLCCVFHFNILGCYAHKLSENQDLIEKNLNSKLLFDYDQIFSLRNTPVSEQRGKHWDNPKNSCTILPFSKKHILFVGEELKVGDYLESENAKLVLEASGNLRLFNKFTNYTFWSSNTSSKGATALKLTKEGIFLDDATGKHIWHKNFILTERASLTLHDNCNFALFEEAPFSTELWSTNSGYCLNVHVVPHSHDDVGWLLTPEMYYTGCYDPKGGVQNIITTVVLALDLFPERTYIQVEAYFFHRWWLRQNQKMRQITRRVIERGQLKFVNNGWSMHDEACVHQESAIANMMEGAQFLRKEFGDIVNVTIGWHIDPFGHASTTPRIMSQMGFDAFFFWRTDYQHREQMINTKTLETLWDNSDAYGNQTTMFTSIMPNSYCVNCGGSNNLCPIKFSSFSCMDNKHPPWAVTMEQMRESDRPQTKATSIRQLFKVSENEPIDPVSLAKHVFEEWIKYGNMYRSNNILIPWGCDFAHMNAFADYEIMDLVLEEINKLPDAKGANFKAFYSTPENYIKKVKEAKMSWPVNHYDYFIDSDNGHAYWSGYFSSRAQFKRFERDLMNRRSASEIMLSSVTPKKTSFSARFDQIDTLRQAMGIAQHHDAITGTERESVRNDYNKILTESMNSADVVMGSILEEITALDGVFTCPLSNLSTCLHTEALDRNFDVTVVLYNPLQQVADQIVTIPIPINNIMVSSSPIGFDPGYSVESQVQDTWELSTTRDPLTVGAKPLPFELLLKVKLPPLQTVLLMLKKTEKGKGVPYVPSVKFANPIFNISNNLMQVTVDADYGLLSMKNIADNLETPLTSDYQSYCPMAPHWLLGKWPNNWIQSSGAYIFRTCKPTEEPKAFNTLYSSRYVNGSVCQEIRSLISDIHNIHQTIRLCKDQRYVSLISGIGEVKPEETGKEVVLTINSDIKNKGIYYTDSEALEMQKRVRNERPNYNFNVTEPIASNFFPVNQIAMIADEESDKKQRAKELAFAVVTDSSRATSSLKDGELEMLMLRRLLYDDARGVNQALNESSRIISHHILVLEEKSKIMNFVRNISVQHAHPALVFFSHQTKPHMFSPSHHRLPQFDKVLPGNIHLHTRVMIDEETMLIRLQNIFDPKKTNRAVEVDLNDALPWDDRSGKAFIKSFEETDLNGVSPLSYINKVRNVYVACNHQTGRTFSTPTPFENSIIKNTTVLIRPMEIHTYLLKVGWTALH